MVKHRMLSILGIAAGLYASLCIYLYFYQARLVYFPQREILVTPGQLGLPYEPVSFPTSDGLELSAWWIPARDATGVLLFCHGNAGNISHRLESLRIFHRLGLDSFIFDYRGYGSSQGTPSEQGTYLDAEAAWRYLVDRRKVAPEKIVIFGESLGGAVAARLASRQPAAALILMSAFTSIADVGAFHYPYFLVRLLSRFQYRTAQSLSRVQAPVLIIHSRQDEIVPFSHGLKLLEAAREPKAFLPISGDHNGGFLTSGTVYEEGLRNFLGNYLP